MIRKASRYESFIKHNQVIFMVDSDENIQTLFEQLVGYFSFREEPIVDFPLYVFIYQIDGH